MSEERHLRLTLAIRTLGPKHCATEWEVRCQFYDDYECKLFPGNLLATEGLGETFRVIRCDQCLVSEVSVV